MISHSKYHITLFLLFLITFSFAQPNHGFFSEPSLNSVSGFTIQYWNSENGLPQNSVAALAQTPDGYLWIGTFNGLTRFDGASFVTYNTGNSNDLLADGALKFLVTPDGLVFVDGKGNLMRYRNSRFRNLLPADFRHLRADFICNGEDGMIFFTTYNGEIYSLSESRVNLIATIHEGHIKGIEFTSDDFIVVKLDRLILAYKNGTVTRHIIGDTTRNALNTFFKLNDSALIITHETGLMEFSNGNLKPLPWPYSFDPHKIFYIHGRKMATGNFFNGCFIIDGNNKWYINKSTGLTSNSINAVYIDREDNIWVGTNDAGLNKLTRKKFITYSKEDGLAGDAVGPIIQKSTGEILISNFCDGLTRFSGNRLSPVKVLETGCIWSLLEDHSHDLWMGTYLPALFVYTPPRLKEFTTSSGLPSNIVFSMYMDFHERIWIGTLSGIARYENEKFHIVRDRILEQSRVYFISETQDGRIMAGTDNGIFFIRNDEVVHVGQQEGLPHQVVRYIHEDREGIFWICTYGGGLIRMRENKFYSYAGKGVPMDNFLSCLAEDENDFFWITSNNGLYCISRNDLNQFADGKTPFLFPRKFTRQEGLKTDEFNGGFYPSFLKDKGNKLWFPSIKGVVTVKPGEIGNRGNLPDIFIEEIAVDGIPVFRNSGPGNITVPRNVKILEVAFSSPAFSGIDNLWFQTRLEGKEKEWSEPTSGRKVIYSNLRAGKYRFSIRHYGSLDNTVNKETSIAFSVPYPFWQTFPFFMICLALLAGGGFFSYRYQVKRIERKKLAETEIKTRYAELEMKALQAQMNPHFIFNCLNSIKYFISANDPDAAGKYLGKFSKLVRIFMENSRSNFTTLKDELALISLYVELEQMRADKKFNYKLNIDKNIVTESTEIPAGLLQPYVENAIHHGLGNLQREGTLAVSVHKTGNHLIIAIDDDGIGRDKAKELQLTGIQEHKPMGMAMTSERIALLNTIHKAEISITITNKFDINKEIRGTRVSINIPLS